jgi:hypothetical protein
MSERSKPGPGRAPTGDDILTARQLVEQYGLAPRVAESIVRSLLRQGKGVALPIRRRAVRRRDVFPDAQSDGGKTWA